MEENIRFTDIISDIIVGLLCFSPICLLFPAQFSTIELYFILFVIFKKKQLLRSNEIQIWHIFVGILFLILGIIGFYEMNPENIIMTYRLVREWLLILIFVILFINSPLLSEHIFWICLGATIGGLIFAIDGLKTLVLDETNYLCPNIVAMPLLVCMSFYRGIISKILVFLIVFSMCALSQTRGIVLYGILAYIISYIIYTYSQGNNIFNKLSILIATGFMGLYYVYLKIEGYVENVSPYLHYRLYNKLQEIGENDADEHRIECYIYYLNNWPDYLLPHGFYLRLGALEWTRNVAPGLTDSGYIEMIYTFGLVLVLVIAMMFLKMLLNLISHIQELNLLTTSAIVTSIFLTFALTMGYAIFNAPYNAATWGLYIALCITLEKKLK